jgi:hypothetical protein
MEKMERRKSQPSGSQERGPDVRFHPSPLCVCLAPSSRPPCLFCFVFFLPPVASPVAAASCCSLCAASLSFASARWQTRCWAEDGGGRAQREGMRRMASAFVAVRSDGRQSLCEGRSDCGCFGPTHPASAWDRMEAHK